MAFQVLVKTLPGMHGAYTYLLPDKAAADEFVQRDDIWWYHYPLEDEDWRWHRGGAWKPAHALAVQDYEDLESGVPQPPAGHSAGAVVIGDDDDDDRW